MAGPRSWPLAFILILLLQVGTASAAPASGSLTLESFALPSSSTTAGAPLAFLAKGSHDVTMTGNATRVHVIVLTQTVAVVSDTRVQIPRSDTRRDYDLTAATITASGADERSIIGGFPTESSRFLLHGASQTSAGIAGPFGENRAEVTGSYDPTVHPFYTTKVASDHLTVSGRGTSDLFAAWTIQIRGFQLTMDAAEGHFAVLTGTSKDSAAQETTTWVLLESSALALTVSSPSGPMTAALATADSRWTGEATVSGIRGRLSVGGHAYDAGASAATVSGDLQLVSHPVGSSSGSSIASELAGDLGSTSLATIPIPAPRSRVPVVEALSPWMWGVGLLTAGTVAVGAVATYRDAHPGQRYLRRAAEALDDGDRSEAFRWVELAAEARDRTAGTLMWAALLHRQDGNLAAARARMELAVGLAPENDGRPDYYLAGLLMEALQAEAGALSMDPGRELTRQDAMVHLERALQREPRLVAEIQNDALFESLHGLEFDAMIAEARTRR